MRGNIFWWENGCISGRCHYLMRNIVRWFLDFIRDLIFRGMHSRDILCRSWTQRDLPYGPFNYATTTHPFIILLIIPLSCGIPTLFTYWHHWPEIHCGCFSLIGASTEQSLMCIQKVQNKTTTTLSTLTTLIVIFCESYNKFVYLENTCHTCCKFMPPVAYARAKNNTFHPRVLCAH